MRITVPKAAAEHSMDGAQHIVLGTVVTDCFTDPNLPVLLARFDSERYVGYGVVTKC